MWEGFHSTLLNIVCTEHSDRCRQCSDEWDDNVLSSETYLLFSGKNRQESKRLQCVKDRVIREHAFCIQPRIYYVFLKMLKENVLKFLTVTTVREKVVTIKHPILFKFSIHLFLVALGLLAVCWLSLVKVVGGRSSLWYEGSPSRWLLLLQRTGSRHSGFSSCGTGLVLGGIWNLLTPGIEPTFSALAGRFVSLIASPGKSKYPFLKNSHGPCSFPADSRWSMWLPQESPPSSPPQHSFTSHPMPRHRLGRRHLWQFPVTMKGDFG